MSPGPNTARGRSTIHDPAVAFDEQLAGALRTRVGVDEARPDRRRFGEPELIFVAIEHRAGGDVDEPRQAVAHAEIDHVRGRLHVLRAKLGRAAPRRGPRRGVDDDIGTEAEVERTREIGGHVARQREWTAPRPCDLEVTARAEARDERAADEARRAGDENFHPLSRAFAPSTIRAATMRLAEFFFQRA